MEGRHTMRKALVGVVLAVSMTSCLALYACSGESSDTTTNASTSDIPQQATQQEPDQKDSKYAVSIDDCSVTTDYNGTPAIVVTYTFTNNSDKAIPFMTAVSAKAFQNGVQLDTAIVTNDIDTQSAMNEIKSGATTTVQEAYLLDDESDVNIECTELFSFDDTIIAEKTFVVI